MKNICMNSRKQDLLKHVGDITQIFGAKSFIFSDGMAKGCRGIDIDCGSGLSVTIIPDRCMDIYALKFKGLNCGYLSKTGLVAPGFFEKNGDEYLRTFYAGFLTTCGLRNFGPACEVNGEQHPFHGRISHIQAENLSTDYIWNENDLSLVIKGNMREAKAFKENLCLTREYCFSYGKTSFKIHDTVENLGFRREPLMLLYHMNVGFPLLDHSCDIFLPESKYIARDKVSATQEHNLLKVIPPSSDCSANVYFHELKAQEGNVYAGIKNNNLRAELRIGFAAEQFNRMTYYKSMNESEYMVSFEPTISLPSLARAISENTINYIEPGETKQFDLEVSVSHF